MSSSESNSSTASQAISTILWNPRVHYSKPLVLILSKVYIFHAFLTDPFKIQFNSIIPSNLGIQVASFLRFSPAITYMHIFFTPMCYMTRPSHSFHYAVFSRPLLPLPSYV